MSESNQSQLSRSRRSLSRVFDSTAIEVDGEYFLVGKWSGGARHGVMTANYIGVDGNRRLGTILLSPKPMTLGRYVVGPVSYYCVFFKPDGSIIDILTGEATTIAKALGNVDEGILGWLKEHKVKLAKVPKNVRERLS